MIDRDLAELYGVSTKVLNQAVKRNRERFPADFMFNLSRPEKEEVVTNCDHLESLKYSATNPNVFTEQGVAMLSTVLNSDQAIQVNIAIMRAFVKLRKILNANRELDQRLNQLEKRMGKKDQEVKLIFEAIRQLMRAPDTPKRRIGFHTD